MGGAPLSHSPPSDPGRAGALEEDQPQWRQVPVVSEGECFPLYHPACLDLPLCTAHTLALSHSHLFSLLTQAVDYWANTEASYNGVLGGFEQLSSPDIRDSTQFIDKVCWSLHPACFLLVRHQPTT